MKTRCANESGLLNRFKIPDGLEHRPVFYSINCINRITDAQTTFDDFKVLLDLPAYSPLKSHKDFDKLLS
jgi:hypothetical protein